MLEEALIRQIKSFDDFLNGLRVQAIHSVSFSEVSLESAYRYKRFVDSVILSLQGKASVPNETGIGKHTVDMLVVFAVVYLEPERYHRCIMLNSAKIVIVC